MNMAFQLDKTMLLRVRRLRREIVFAVALTLAATIYLLASGAQEPPKEPIAMKANPVVKQVQ
ncbi:MAG: hypothetical protein K0U34_02400 [Alphaproteobacteria bacterium]|nr:hypothetical protein [Alphaproteobacteria bacterium]